MKSSRGPGGPEKEVDKRSHALMEEFRAHFQEYVRLHPEHASKGDQIYQSWAIQKIAGLQLSVEELARKHNELIQKPADLF